MNMIFNMNRSVFILIILMFSIQFCFAVNDSSIPSQPKNLNFTEINYTQPAKILSPTEKVVWITIIALIVILLIALFVLAYLLKNLNPNKIVFKKISGAEQAIAKKGIERAKKLS